MSFISSFEIIKVVVPDPSINFWIHASIAEADAVIPNGAKTFSAIRIATDLLIYSIMILKTLQADLF